MVPAPKIKEPSATSSPEPRLLGSQALRIYPNARWLSGAQQTPGYLVRHADQGGVVAAHAHRDLIVAVTVINYPLGMNECVWHVVRSASWCSC
jgi:hypothetical protein